MLHFPSSGSLLGSYKKGTHQKEKKFLSWNRRSPFSFIQCRECAQFIYLLLVFNLTDTSWTGLSTKHFNFQLSNRVLSDSFFSDDDQICSWNRMWWLWQTPTYPAFLQWQQQAHLLFASLPSVEMSIYQEGLRVFHVWRDQAHAGSVQIHTSYCFSEDSSKVTSWKPLKSFCMISHGFILFVDAEGWKLALQPVRLCLLWALNRWMDLVREGIICSTPTFQTFGSRTA